MQTSDIDYAPLFYMVSFTDDSQIYMMLTTEIEEPPMAELFIPFEQAGKQFGVTCYVSNKKHWEPADLEEMILKRYFQENGLPSI
jgi:hypothetical protein